jgi:mono/diheme cytochrome c family protein
MGNPSRSATGRLLPAILSLLLTTGCRWPGEPDKAQRPVPSDKVADFSTLFSENCSGCHGAEGKMGPAPPLNDPLFLSIIPDEELRRVIREGRRGTPMPAFSKSQGGSLTEDQVSVLVKGIKTKWAEQLPPAKAKPPPYLPPDGSTERGRTSVKRGKDVFMRACTVCHGDEGKGVAKDGRRSLKINDPAFLALISDQALRRFAITGRADLGMPNYSEKRPDEADFKPLTASEIDDVVALMSSWKPAKGPKSRRSK